VGNVWIWGMCGSGEECVVVLQTEQKKRTMVSEKSTVVTSSEFDVHGPAPAMCTSLSSMCTPIFFEMPLQVFITLFQRVSKKISDSI
jgi:hypothetical protein